MRNKPSRTAYKVAMNLLTLSLKPGMDQVIPQGLIDATERLLIASGAASQRMVRLAKKQGMIKVYRAFDWILPGQFEAFGHRKAFCERQVRQGIHSGATQVLVLGAGYDTLGWRLAPEFPDITFFEIDHPATAALKAKGVQAMGLRDNHHLLAEDLGQRNLVDVLSSNSHWNRNAPTVFIAEGLVMYLEPSAVKDLFARCAEICGSSSHFVFSYIPADNSGRLNAGKYTGLMLKLQKLAGESWLWSIHPDKLGQFLVETGWAFNPDNTGNLEKHGVEYFCAVERIN